MSKFLNEEFGINRVAYDLTTKERVKVSNGVCILDHSTPAAFKSAHGGDGNGCCVYEPSEAVAVRLLGFDEDGRPVIGWSYIGVKGHKLMACKPEDVSQFEKMWEAAQQVRANKKSKACGVGRF